MMWLYVLTHSYCPRVIIQLAPILIGKKKVVLKLVSNFYIKIKNNKDAKKKQNPKQTQVYSCLAWNLDIVSTKFSFLFINIQIRMSDQPGFNY